MLFGVDNNHRMFNGPNQFLIFGVLNRHVRNEVGYFSHLATFVFLGHHFVGVPILFTTVRERYFFNVVLICLRFEILQSFERRPAFY